MITDERLPERPPLVVDSPVTRAIHQLMAGDRVVRLRTPDGPTTLSKVIDLLHWLWPLSPDRAVGLLVPTRADAKALGAQVRVLINDQWDGWGTLVADPAQTALAGKQRRGVAGPLWLEVANSFVGQGIRHRRHALVVTGFEPEPCRTCP